MAGDRYNAMLTWLRQWYSENAAMRTQQQMNLVKSASAFGLCRYYCNSWMTVTYSRNP